MIQSVHHVMPAPSSTQKILEELPGYRHKPTEAISKFCRNLSGWEKLHYAWIIPVNTLLNLVNIALAPLAALYHLLTASIYGLASLSANKESSRMYPPVNKFPLCSDRDVYINRAKTHALLAPHDVFVSIFSGIAHIINPGSKDRMSGGIASDEFDESDIISQTPQVGLTSSSDVGETSFAGFPSSSGLDEFKPKSQIESTSEKEEEEIFIPIQFKTRVLPKNSSGESVQLAMYDTGKKRDFYPVYCLKDAATGTTLGEIDLAPGLESEYISISFMRSHSNDTYKNIGRALHEFAIRKSFEMGFQGNVRLISDHGIDGFHFKCGFRYQLPFMYAQGNFCIVGNKLLGLIEDYLAAKAKDNHESTDAIFAEISQISEEHLNNPNPPRYFTMLKEVAAIELNREPENLQEIVENGFYINMNDVLERLYYHPEDTTRTYMYKPDEPVNRGGIMYVGEEEISKWKQIIESEK